MKSELRSKIDTFCEEHYPDEEIVLFGEADGNCYDVVFVGVGRRINQVPVAVYDREKGHDILCEEHGMTSEEAIEFFDYNIIGAGMDNAPLFLDSFEYKEER